MSDTKGAINVQGPISGTGIVVGHGSQASVRLSAEERDRVLALLEELRAEVGRASLPESSKGVLGQAVREMQEAAGAADPKPGLQAALAKADVVLESVGATAERTAGILEMLRAIAGHAGIAIGTVAPFVARLVGG